MVGNQVDVPVIIKAPNQKIDDMLVNCSSSWTVHELKSHLSQVYPSKPHPNGQKLIYSGKLLLDNMTITDVLKSYNGQQNNTIHLVCSLTRDNVYFENKTASKESSTRSPSEKATEKEEERARCCTAGRQPPVSLNSFSALKFTPPNSENNYTQIYNERAYMMNSYMQYISQHVQWSVTSNSAARFLSNEVPEENSRNNINQAENEENNAAAGGAGGAGVAGGGDEERQQAAAAAAAVAARDWLDWVYIVSRLIVLFTVVYFYSSPLRCIMVTAMALILYHLGMFRLRQFPINNIFNNFNNNNINNNNNNANEQEAADDDLIADTTNNRHAAPLVHRFAWIKTVINFIINFLLSLVPDNRDN